MRRRAGLQRRGVGVQVCDTALEVGLDVALIIKRVLTPTVILALTLTLTLTLSLTLTSTLSLTLT